MYIVYDDMNEYAEAAIQCKGLFESDSCGPCPFVDSCGAAIDKDISNAAVRCGEIRYRKEKNNG